MRFIYDPHKRAANLAKHGFDLAEAATFEWHGALVRPTRNGRSAAIGRFGTVLIAVIFAPLGAEAISVISMRRASRRERRLFDGRR